MSAASSPEPDLARLLLRRLHGVTRFGGPGSRAWGRRRYKVRPGAAAAGQAAARPGPGRRCRTARRRWGRRDRSPRRRPPGTAARPRRPRPGPRPRGSSWPGPRPDRPRGGLPRRSGPSRPPCAGRQRPPGTPVPDRRGRWPRWTTRCPGRLWRRGCPGRLWRRGCPGRLWRRGCPGRRWRWGCPGRLWRRAHAAPRGDGDHVQRAHAAGGQAEDGAKHPRGDHAHPKPGVGPGSDADGDGTQVTVRHAVV